MSLHAMLRPATWYSQSITGSLELLRAYAADLEAQVEHGVEQFRAGTTTVEITSGDTEWGQTVEVHKGLDDGACDLKSIFEEHFPNLQRRSALITAFAFFERELDDLCATLAASDGYQLGVRDIQGSALERALIYLGKVVGIPARRDAKSWQEIKRIQGIRNLVAHHDGRLGPDKAAEAKYARECPLLAGGNEVLIQRGFLLHALDTFDEHFQLLDEGLQAKYGARRPPTAAI